MSQPLQADRLKRLRENNAAARYEVYRTILTARQLRGGYLLVYVKYLHDKGIENCEVIEE